MTTTEHGRTASDFRAAGRPAVRLDTEAQRRQELGAFLRVRRARLQPTEVGLASTGPRRTPGLRREEVAIMAGVGVSWYTWLEQGRRINPSESVLASIARTLQLSEAETDHIFILAGMRPEVTGTEASGTGELPEGLRRLVDLQTPAAAYLMDSRWDLVCWNSVAGALLGFDGLGSDRRNVALQMFAPGVLRDCLDDWERHARSMVAELRLASGRLVGDARFGAVLDRLRHEHAEVDSWWSLGEVRCRLDVAKTFTHPHAGTVQVDELILRPAAAPDHQLTVLAPRPGSEAALRSLAAGAG
ncbi:MAG TPA: helix-turn-helix transcriptional regulator [Actinopolymorphaceae bacterium]|nr:helix-turn-helix transcriptional regulator [Actinopolymorphaceae bacterium]